MAQDRPRHFPSVSLGEVIALFFVFLILAAILYPIFASSRHPRSHPGCASLMKQIGLAYMGYAQDNDEHFPPAVGQVRLSDGSLYEQQWGITTSVRIAGREEAIPGILSRYVKSNSIFQCPAVEKSVSGLTCLYNDLAANASMAEVLHPARSILVAESEDHLRNIGHSRSQSSEGSEAVLVPLQEKQAPKLLIGATIGDAAVRHTPGANYLFLDGHVKWNTPDAIFFPPRTSNSSSYRESNTGKLLGPDPNGKMTYQGKTYTATFHLR